MANFLEMSMLILFGLSWPISIAKTLKSKSVKGKSILFELFIWIGYVLGIAKKAVEFGADPNQSFLFFMAWGFYILNIVAITIDMALYLRNFKAEGGAAA